MKFILKWKIITNLIFHKYLKKRADKKKVILHQFLDSTVFLMWSFIIGVISSVPFFPKQKMYHTPEYNNQSIKGRYFFAIATNVDVQQSTFFERDVAFGLVACTQSSYLRIEKNPIKSILKCLISIPSPGCQN